MLGPGRRLCPECSGLVAKVIVYGTMDTCLQCAAPERLAWGIEVARDARREAGLDPDAIQFGAYVACGCHPKIDTARDLVRGGLSEQTRFGVMHGKTSGQLTDSQKEVMHKLRDSYNMNLHTRDESEQANILKPEFIDAYAIIGMPDQVSERILELEKLGIDKLIMGGHAPALAARLMKRGHLSRRKSCLTLQAFEWEGVRWMR